MNNTEVRGKYSEEIKDAPSEMAVARKPLLAGNRNQCCACSEYFNSNGAFDRHRQGSYAKDNRYCLTTGEMIKLGFVVTDKGFWAQSVREANRKWYERIDRS